MPTETSTLRFEDDLSNSIPFDLERSLDNSFFPLLDWFVEKLVASDPTLRRPTSRAKIRDAFDCLLANLLDAHWRSSDCFLGTPLHARGFTFDERYQQRTMGYAAFNKVRKFLIESHPPFATNHPGNYNRQLSEPRGRTARLRATPELLNFVDVYLGRIRLADSSRVDVDEVARATRERFTDSSSSNPTTIFIPFTATKHISKSDVIVVRDAEGNPVDEGDPDVTRGISKSPGHAGVRDFPLAVLLKTALGDFLGMHADDADQQRNRASIPLAPNICAPPKKRNHLGS